MQLWQLCSKYQYLSFWFDTIMDPNHDLQYALFIKYFIIGMCTQQLNVKRGHASKAVCKCMAVCTDMLRSKNALISSSNCSHSFSECKLGYVRFADEDDNFCHSCPYPTFGRRCLNDCNCSKHQRYDTNIITQLFKYTMEVI